jgi:hypothetical protein
MFGVPNWAGSLNEMAAKSELIVEVLDRALAGVQGHALMSRQEVIDMLLDLRTALDDIARVECLEHAVARSERRSRFLRAHRGQSVLTGG